MLYRSNRDLPTLVRNHLPPRAQDIYREAFNNAFASHSGSQNREENSHRIAWATVKRLYVRSDDECVPFQGVRRRGERKSDV
jgi:cation transport regulator